MRASSHEALTMAWTRTSPYISTSRNPPANARSLPSGSAAPVLGVPELSPVSSAFNGTICALGSSNGGVTMSPWHHRDKSCRRGQHPTSLCLTDGHLFHALRFTALPEAMIRFAVFSSSSSFLFQTRAVRYVGSRRASCTLCRGPASHCRLTHERVLCTTAL